MEKKYFTKLFFGAIFIISTNLYGQIPTNGLIAWYPFNGNTNDVSGNGYHGINYGATLVPDRFGNSNSAYEFNGVDNYINTTLLNCFTNQMSVALWFNSTNTSYASALIASRNGYTNFSGIDVMYNGAIGFTAKIANMVITNNNTNYISNSWHFVVGTYDGTSQKIYLDGLLITQNNQTGDVDDAVSYLIGYDQCAVCPENRHFNGKIDDICIYNRVLTDQEIQQLYSYNVIQCPISITYGGQTYNTVQIGDQCWLKENLNIGTRIDGTLDQTNNSIIEKYCYNDLESNCDIYGGLYQWDEMMQYINTQGVQGICPAGWHLPSDEDWCILTTFLDPTLDCNSSWAISTAGGQMKEAGYEHWNAPNKGANNLSGLTIRGAGLLRPLVLMFNGFGELKTSSYLWTSTETSIEKSFYINFNNINSSFGNAPDLKTHGFAVRCLKDNCASNLPVSVSIDASSNPVCTGATSTFTATPTNGGTNPVFLWKVNGTNVGSNSSTYSYIPSNGDIVTCVLTSDENCVTDNPATSSSITMTVYPTFVVGTISDDQSICYSTAPAQLTGTAPTGGNTPYAYQWQNSSDGISFTDLPDTTEINFQPGSLSNTTIYRQIQTSANGCGTVITNVVTITVNPIPEVTIDAIPSNNTYTGAISTTIFLGYGPQSVTISATATGGSGFTYSWSSTPLGLAGLNCTSCSSPVFTPTEEGRYTFTVSVTNNEGCSSTASIEICVLDIQVPGSNNKVYLCHNQNNPQTLSVSVNAVPAHVPGHPGDFLGKCNQSCEIVGYKIGETTGELYTSSDNTMSVIVYPNPFSTTFILLVETESTEPIQVRLYDMTGKIIHSINGAKNGEPIEITPQMTNGIYLLYVNQGDKYQKVKLVKDM